MRSGKLFLELRVELAARRRREARVHRSHRAIATDEHRGGPRVEVHELAAPSPTFPPARRRSRYGYFTPYCFVKACHPRERALLLGLFEVERDDGEGPCRDTSCRARRGTALRRGNSGTRCL